VSLQERGVCFDMQSVPGRVETVYMWPAHDIVVSTHVDPQLGRVRDEVALITLTRFLL